MDVNMLKCKKCGGWYNGFLNAECPYCNGTKAPKAGTTEAADASQYNKRGMHLTARADE